MKVRGLPIALLVAMALGLGVLPGLAYASSPDPSWIGGIYDGSDYDDVVVLVTFATSGVSLAPVADLHLDLRVMGSILPSASPAIPALWASAVLSRGPPNA